MSREKRAHLNQENQRCFEREFGMDSERDDVEEKENGVLGSGNSTLF